MDPSQLNCCCRIKVIDAKRNGADWVKKNKESGGCGRGGEKSCVYFGRPLFFFLRTPYRGRWGRHGRQRRCRIARNENNGVEGQPCKYFHFGTCAQIASSSEGPCRARRPKSPTHLVLNFLSKKKHLVEPEERPLKSNQTFALAQK